MDLSKLPLGPSVDAKNDFAKKDACSGELAERLELKAGEEPMWVNTAT